MVCKYCGKNLEDGSMFCNSCGQATTPVNGVQQQYPVQQYPVQQQYPFQNMQYQYVNRGGMKQNNEMLYIIIGLLALIGLGIFIFVGDYCDIRMPWDEFF